MGADSSDPGRVLIFCSARGGIGRTTTVANVAVILARAGMRVLVVDCEPGSRDFHRYLREYLPDELDPHGRGLSDMIALHARDPAASGLSSDTIRLNLDDATGDGAIDLLTYGSASRSSSESLRLALESGWITTFRSYLKASGYDYALIDAPVGLSDDVTAWIAGLGHQAVVCFPLTRHSIDDAAELAAAIRGAAPHPPRIVPLAMKVDRSVPDVLDELRDLARTRFAALAGPIGDTGEPADLVQVFYEASYSASDVPAVLQEPAGQAGGVREACERLVEVLTDGRVAALTRVLVVYTPRYEAWAEWIADQVDRAGVRIDEIAVTDFAWAVADPHTVVLLVSPPGLDRRLVRRLADLTRHSRVLAVRVDDARFPGTPAHLDELDLGGELPEGDVRERLYDGLRIGGPPSPRRSGVFALAGARRFPRPPDTERLPDRNPSFVGRDAVIRELRDFLTADDDAVRWVTLRGVAGVGKSQIALEYAHRYAGAYDVVWWVAAETPQTVRAGLSGLAARLELPRGTDLVDTVLHRLSHDRELRWLLVYDNVEDLSALNDLIPRHGTGDVVITAREVEPSDHARHIEVKPLGRAESLELIRYKQLTWPHLGVTFPRELIPESAAEVLARTVGGYPLAIELAAGWVLDRLSGLRQDNEMVAARAAETVAEFVAEFDREAAALNRRPPGAPAHPLPYQVTVKLAMERLLAGPGGEAGRRVLRMCAFLSPDGVEVDRLRSPAMCDELAGQGVGFHYPLLVDAVLWAIDRYGLAAVSFARGGRLKMHRVVAEFVRADMGAAQAETQAETERTAIYRVLAAYQPPPARPPTGSDQAVAWDQAVVETSAHIDAKYAAASTEPAVRRWVVDQVHRLVEVADKSAWERARQIGDACALRWEPDSDALLLRPERPDDSIARRLLVKVDLLVELAEACRKLGSYDQALGHIRRAWQWQRRILRDPHPQLWATMSRHAMILRARGDFQEAFGWDDRAVKNLRDLLGADHHTTGRVLNNLAASMHLNGDYTAALELAKERFERTRRVAGEDDDDAWWTAVNIAGTLRCLGEYEDAYLLLKRALGRLVRREKEPFGTRSLDRLRIEYALAVTERGLGKVSESRSRNAEVLEQYRRLLGDDDMLTLRCLAGVAADLHAQGDHAGAVERARDCYERFDRTLPGHPFTYMCQANLAVYLRAEGQRLDDALAHGEQSRSGLAERLGEWHPVTLAAIVNHASTQLLVNGPQAALDLERVACERLQWLFGAAETRDLRIARDNMRNTLANLGSKAPRVRARYGTPVGAEEPPARRDIEIEVPGY